MIRERYLTLFCLAQLAFLAFCALEKFLGFNQALIGAALALILAILDVRWVVLCGKEGGSPTVSSAVALFISLLSAVFAGVFGSWIYIAAAAVGVVCAVLLDRRAGSVSIAAVLFRVVSVILIMAFIALVMGRLAFSSFGKTTVVKSAKSPDGRYEARLLDIDEGAMGGSTAVEIDFSIDIGLSSITLYSKRVYASSWVGCETLRGWTFEWTDNQVISVNGSPVKVSLASPQSFKIIGKKLVVNGHNVDVIIDDYYTRNEEERFLTLYENGASLPCDAFKSDELSVYTAKYGCFDSHVSDGRVMNTLVDMKLTDENEASVEITPELKSIFEAVSKVRHSVMEMYILKPGGEYYVAVELNVNLWTPCILYWFDTDKEALVEIYENDAVKYTGLRLRPATSA